MAAFGEAKALVVTRFDRRWQGVAAGAETKARFKRPEGVWIARLPQEDCCQALGVAPDRKDQSDGGPSVQDCLTVLAASEDADKDRAVFALAQLAFWLMAAIDGHAKNFSIQHRRGGRFSLTPLYDVLSAWPIIGDGPNRIAYQSEAGHGHSWRRERALPAARHSAPPLATLGRQLRGRRVGTHAGLGRQRRRRPRRRCK